MTYNNDCLLEIANCERAGAEPITVIGKGPCPEEEADETQDKEQNQDEEILTEAAG